MFTIPKDKFLYFDGAMGTMITAMGGNGGMLNELLNIHKPDMIRQIHKMYCEAGCDILKTNTFGANRFRLADCGHSVEEVVFAAVENAKIASEGKKYLAMDIGPTGKMLEPLGDLSFEDAASAFGEMAEAGEKAGVDLILIETMSDIYELKAAVVGAKDRCSLPIVATVTVDQSGRLLTGADIAGVMSLLRGLGVKACGLNCGLSCGQILELLPQIKEFGKLPIILNPNAGLPVVREDGTVGYDLTPDDFAEQMLALSETTGAILGGCCGTNPQYIKKMIDKTTGRRPVTFDERDIKLVSSYRRTAIKNPEEPLKIVDLREVTAKMNGDAYSVVDAGIEYQCLGADILYIDRGDGSVPYRDLVKTVQESITLPLMLDGGDAEALRIYNGRPLIYNTDEGNMNDIEYYGGILCDSMGEADKNAEYVLCTEKDF